MAAQVEFPDEELKQIISKESYTLQLRLLAQLILEAREQKDILRVIKNKYLESL